MGLTVLVIDETLGEPSMVIELLEELQRVDRALVARRPEDVALVEGADVVVLGASWLGWAKEFRRRFPSCELVGRGPWQGNVEAEFFPWGDKLREPTLPITALIPFGSIEPAAEDP